MISIYRSIRLYGALIHRLMIGQFAFMRIIFKILEEILLNTCTK